MNSRIRLTPSATLRQVLLATVGWAVSGLMSQAWAQSDPHSEQRPAAGAIVETDNTTPRQRPRTARLLEQIIVTSTRRENNLRDIGA